MTIINTMVMLTPFIFTADDGSPQQKLDLIGVCRAWLP